MWNESEGHRGAIEIGTAVYKWLMTKDREQYEKCILYSDTCSDQNCNRMKCDVILTVLSKCSNLKQVHQKFF